MFTLLELVEVAVELNSISSHDRTITKPKFIPQPSHLETTTLRTRKFHLLRGFTISSTACSVESDVLDFSTRRSIVPEVCEMVVASGPVIIGQHEAGRGSNAISRANSCINIQHSTEWLRLGWARTFLLKIRTIPDEINMAMLQPTAAFVPIIKSAATHCGAHTRDPPRPFYEPSKARVWSSLLRWGMAED